MFFFSHNDGDNPFHLKTKPLAEPVRVPMAPTIQPDEKSSTNQTQITRTANQIIPPNTTKQTIRVTSNPNQNFQIPTAASKPVLSAKNSSAISKAHANNPAFRYRPKTLNTANSGDKVLGQAKVTNTSSRKPTATKNEPVYATVGSVNSNQRLVKNLKSANV